MERNKKKSRLTKTYKKEKETELNESNEIVDSSYTPEFMTVLKALLSSRFCAALWNHISDCDETFNYWEPMHYLVHGHGFQTWEYSSAYALRSYAYLYLHIWPIKIYHIFSSKNKIFEFFLIRCTLGFISALCDTIFFCAVRKHFGNNAANILLFILTFSSGMFVASTALLPSSFTMYTTSLALSAWMYGCLYACILFFACGSIVGWPFAAALGIPYAVECIFIKADIKNFVKWSTFSLVIFLLPVVAIDSHIYGKLVVAPFNIIYYNLFSENGPDLYGKEPLSFYFLNLFLNFNIAFISSLLVLPTVLICDYLAEDKRAKTNFLIFSTMFLWMLIFFTAEHKEERFLFPIYHLICLSAAVFVDYVQRIFSGIMQLKNYIETTSFIPICFCILFIFLSISRTFALYFNYRGPLDVYSTFKKFENQKNLSKFQQVNVCVGREWHRFPSHFFMPNNKWRLQFIKSEFKGQLPKHFSSSVEATRIIPSNMNDMNLEEVDRYFNISDCNFIVDLDLASSSNYEPNYSDDKSKFKVLHSETFLDSKRSSRLFRAFYIPFLSAEYTTYVNYNILSPATYARTKSKVKDL